MISVSTVVFDGHDMSAGFDVLASLGIDAVEPAFIKGYVDFDETDFRPAAAAAMAERLRNSGLRAAALSAHIDLGEDDSSDRLLCRADYAARIGAPMVITNATAQANRAAFDATLDRCLPEFAARGVVLALENPGHGSDSLIPSGAAAAALLGSIRHPALRLNYDIGNAMTYGDRRATAQDDLSTALPWCARLHVKDIGIDGPDWHFCAVGDGAVGYADLLPWLFSQGGVPGIGLELPLRLTRPKRGDPVRKPDPAPLAVARSAIEKSVAYCRNQRLKAINAGRAS